MNTRNSEWYAGDTRGGGHAVFTVDGSYNVLDHTAPGIDAKANAALMAQAPQLISDRDSLRTQLAEAVALLRRYVDEHDATWNKLSDHAKTSAMARERHPHGHNENPTRAAMRAFLESVDAVGGKS